MSEKRKFVSKIIDDMGKTGITLTHTTKKELKMAVSRDM
jgi:hypothetical protein